MRQCCWGCGRGSSWPVRRSTRRRRRTTGLWVFVGLGQSCQLLFVPDRETPLPTAIFVCNNLGLVVDRVCDGAVGVAKGDANGNTLAWPVLAHLDGCEERILKKRKEYFYQFAEKMAAKTEKEKEERVYLSVWRVVGVAVLFSLLGLALPKAVEIFGQVQNFRRVSSQRRWPGRQRAPISNGCGTPKTPPSLRPLIR